jgi:DNA-binding response OmpR family regulator
MPKENKKIARSERTKKTTILIIEDDDFLLEMYKSKLELEGYNVLMAQDGENGYEMIRKNNPDVVLLDAVLPKMNGFKVLEKIKQSKMFKHVPIILLTNLSQKEDVKKGLDLGAEDYLIKAHYMPSEVIEKIKKVLK